MSAYTEYLKCEFTDAEISDRARELAASNYWRGCDGWHQEDFGRHKGEVMENEMTPTLTAAGILADRQEREQREVDYIAGLRTRRGEIDAELQMLGAVRKPRVRKGAAEPKKRGPKPGSTRTPRKTDILPVLPGTNAAAESGI